jgi:CRISPR-associated endonuclease Csn1
MGQLFGGDVDIEHILPLSGCLDDSFLNKTLCFADVNRSEKRNRTPFEAFRADPPRWEGMVGRMTRNTREHGMPAIKVERFQLAGEALEKHLTEFKASQLNDTRHASVRAKEYLARLYGGNLSQGIDAAGKRRIVVGNGQATAILRRSLGLDALLPTGPESKRDDHRHHAVDAVAVALTGPATIQRLSSNIDYGKGRPRPGALPAPWKSFTDDLKSAVQHIVVSFRIDNRVRGPLHAESLYSPPRGVDGMPAEGGRFVHVRKRLEALSVNEVEDIVDSNVQSLVKAALNGKSPKDIFLEGKPETYPKLPNKNGKPIPVLRVRIRKAGAAEAIGTGHRQRFVQTDENHHLLVDAAPAKGGKKGVRYRLVSLLDAVRRKTARERILDRQPTTLFSLAKNDLVTCFPDGGLPRLCRVLAISEKEFEGCWATDARLFEQRKKAGARVRVSPSRFVAWNCRKMVVSPIGVLRPCRA